MTRTRLGVGLLLLVGAVSVVFGLRQSTGKDDEKSIAEVQKVVDEIEKKLRAKEVGKALDCLSEMNAKLLTEKEKNDPMRPRSPNPSAALESAVDGLRPELGDFSGELEPMGTKRLGESFVQYLYLMRFARGAIVLRLDFYRSPSGWISHSVLWGNRNSPFDYLK